MLALTTSDDVQGMLLVGRDAVKLGIVREIVFDFKSGSVEFFLVEATSFPGESVKYHPVPFTMVKSGVIRGQLMAAVTEAQFKAAPGFDRDQITGVAYGWNERATRYFCELMAGA